MRQPREALIEFHRVGAYVKVSAVDPETMVEVSIVGDPAAGEAALKRAAVQKLTYVLKRRARAGQGGAGQGGAGQGGAG
jgi:hypothetical protein